MHSCRLWGGALSSCLTSTSQFQEVDSTFGSGNRFSGRPNSVLITSKSSRLPNLSIFPLHIGEQGYSSNTVRNTLETMLTLSIQNAIFHVGSTGEMLGLVLRSMMVF